MCLNVYDYQSKASRCNYGLTYLKTRVSTNQKIDSHKLKRREHKHITQEKHQSTKGKTNRKRRNKEEIQKSTAKQGLRWQ